MNLLGRLRALDEERSSQITSLESLSLALSNLYPLSTDLGESRPKYTQTLAGEPAEEIARNFAGMVSGAYKRNGVIFACMLARQQVFSAARIRWQGMKAGRPADVFGTSDLDIFDTPWVGGTTQDLLSRMIQDADLAGNSFWVRNGGELVRLRPDWVDIVVSKRQFRGGQMGWEKRGYLYYEGGKHSEDSDPVPLLVDEVAHFMPTPDPEASFRGMSWLTPVVREIQADLLMTRHRMKFFEHGATPNMVVKHNTAADPEKVKRFSEEMAEKYGGVENAYRTLNLYPGADVTVVGADLRQIDFKQVQGAGETRIAAAAGVPPVIVGLSEGLQAATYSNYSQARRRFADGTIHPLWQNAAGSLEPVASRAGLRGGGANVRLWYDVWNVPFLREDATDQAAIAQQQATTIKTFIDAGFTPESSVAAVEAGDNTVLQHTGLFSVQLQQAGGGPPENAGQSGAGAQQTGQSGNTTGA